MTTSLQAIISGVPRINGPIHLAAFLFSIICWTLLANIDSSNIQALSVSSALTIATIALPLLLYPAMVKLIPERSRFKYIISLLGLLLSAVLALGFYTYRSAIDPSPKVAKFDVRLVPESTQMLRNANGVTKMVGRLNFKSLEPTSGSGATIFTGMVVVHDESEILKAGLGEIVEASCDQIKSCLGSIVFNQFETAPLLVKAGSMDTEATFSVNLKASAEKLRVWWIFFQRESGNDLECRFNNRVSASSEGIPPLASFHTRTGEIAFNYCYLAQDFSVLSL